MRIQVVLPLAVAAVVYVVAAFWVDLPPYGIWLEEARSQVRIEGDHAETTVDLAYRCTSWRTRGSVLYLPFAGSVQEVTGQVEEGWSYTAHPDGVLLTIRMQPGTTGRARFTFRQVCPEGVFRLDFPVTRDRGRPPSPATWRVEAPPGAQVRPAPGREGVVQGTTDQVLEVRWPIARS